MGSCSRFDYSFGLTPQQGWQSTSEAGHLPCILKTELLALKVSTLIRACLLLLFVHPANAATSLAKSQTSPGTFNQSTSQDLALDASYCSSATAIPFAGGMTGDRKWRPEVSELGFCLDINKSKYGIGSTMPLAVESVGEQILVFGRERISNHFTIILMAGGQINYLPLTYDQRTKHHLEATFVLGSRVFFISYDPAYNLPEGRRRDVSRHVLSLYEVLLSDNGRTFERVAETFLHAGIESGVRITGSATSKWICAQSRCRTISLAARDRLHQNQHNSDLKIGPEFSLPSGEGTYEVLEVASSAGLHPHALLQRTVDDRIELLPGASEDVFLVCSLLQLTPCTPVPPGQIPYRLEVAEGKPKYSLATSKPDLAKVLRHDLRRSGINGTANFAENNLEGRIAWSQAYYLNGLLSALDIADLLELPNEMREDIRIRFMLEAGEMSRLSNFPYPGFLVKRYSPDREAFSSKLHVARIIKPFLRAPQMFDTEVLANMDAAVEMLAPGSITLERVASATDKRRAHARFRKYFPFWADGVRVPWNYQSAWIEAIAWLPNTPDTSRMIAQSMLHDFIENELSPAVPNRWGYVIGEMETGWSRSDRISANTVEYSGDTANPNGAHISYRSMDALALLAAHRTNIITLDEDIIEAFQRLVKEGQLYPFVNEELRLRGETQKVPEHIARIYARSNLPWHVQNQPWALLSLKDERTVDSE